MPIGGTADATGSAGFDSANAGTGGTSQSQAGDGAVGDGDAGQGAVSAGGGSDTAGSGGKSGGSGAGAGGSGAGGKSGSGGAGGGSAGSTNSAGAPPSNTDLIDDFEDGDKLIRIVSNPRRDGIWDTNNDGTAGGVQTPAPSMFAPTLLDATDAPYAGDMYAAHSTGSGFTTFGAYMNVSMRAVADYASTPVYDASSYKGISFLAKASSASTKSMRVRFVSGDTDPRLGKCMVPGTSETACYNHYYATVTLTTTWATHSVDFSSFVQGTNGMMNPSIDLKEMFGLEFYFAPPSNYDLWLDDLNFTK